MRSPGETLPEKLVARSDATAASLLMPSLQEPELARSFAQRKAQSAAAIPPHPATGRARVPCFDLAPLPDLASLPFSFSTSEFESFHRSEIDPEDSPKSPPEPTQAVHRLTQRQSTQRREPLSVHASAKISAPRRQRQIKHPRVSEGAAISPPPPWRKQPVWWLFANRESVS